MHKLIFENIKLARILRLKFGWSPTLLDATQNSGLRFVKLKVTKSWVLQSTLHKPNTTQTMQLYHIIERIIYTMRALVV